MDMVYEDEPASFYNQLRIGLHAFFCPDCAEKIERYETVKAIMRKDFFPSLSDYPDQKGWSVFEDSIMEKVNAEEVPVPHDISGIPSTRGWVIAGLILMVSLVTAFFGFEFKNLADESGMSFMLPMGITIGIILTIYGALFIGSHLKQLSERFGL